MVKFNNLAPNNFQAMGRNVVPISFAYASLLAATNFIDQNELKAMKPVIGEEEVQLFGYDY